MEAAVALWRRMAGAGVERTPGALGALLGACRAALQGERALALLAEARAAGAGRAQPGPLLPCAGVAAAGVCSPGIHHGGIRAAVATQALGKIALCNTAPSR